MAVKSGCGRMSVFFWRDRTAREDDLEGPVKTERRSGDGGSFYSAGSHCFCDCEGRSGGGGHKRVRPPAIRRAQDATTMATTADGRNRA